MKPNDLSYCTYLTIYKGNKMPPFYIGSTSIKNIEDNNYHGSVISKKYKTIWLSELKENPHLFKTEIISKHVTRKTAYTKELVFQETLKVVESPLYINMSYARKNGFGDNYWVGRQHSEETKQKLSLAARGRTPSEETKKKLSLAAKGRKQSEETKLKISIANKNPSEETKLKLSLTSKGRKCSEKTKFKISLANKGRKHTTETKLKMSLAVRGKKRVYSDDGSYTYSIL